MIAVNAPIVPYVGMGGIKLYSKRESLNDILSNDNVTSQVINTLMIRYDIGNLLELFFHRGNNKLFKITTLEGYKGKLFDKIAVGMEEDDFLQIEPSLIYDDFEEIFESEKGVFIETDPITHTAKWISVFIKEIDKDNFEKGDW